MLISIHMPKTAGLSFRATLEEHFGERFAHDYADYPLTHPEAERHDMALRAARAMQPADFASIECIHGHFLPAKYLLLADRFDCRFVTWLREPLARLVSHYHYWQRAYDPGEASTSSLHRRVIEEGWTLQQFCLAPELRNVYSQFLWAFPLSRLDFIGITEYYAEDLRYFSAIYLGNKSAPRYVNEGKYAADGANSGPFSPAARSEIEDFHALDMALYREALKRREFHQGWPG